MKHTTHFIQPGRLALAIAVALSGLTAAHAQDALLSSTSGTLSGISYRLVDLDPNDGITPSLTWEGSAWGLTSFLPTKAEPIPDNPGALYFPGSYPNSEFIGMRAGTPLDGTPNFTATSSDGSTVYAASSGALSINSQLRASNLATIASSQAIPVDAQGNPVPGDYRSDTIHSGASGGYLMHAVPPSEGDPPYYFSNTPMGLTLSANTLLVIRGSFAASASLDPTEMNTRLAQPGANNDYTSATHESEIRLDVSLGVYGDQSSNGGGYAYHASEVTVGGKYSLSAGAESKLLYTEYSGNVEQLVKDRLSQELPLAPSTQSKTWDWSVQYMNTDAVSVEMALNAAIMSANTVTIQSGYNTHIPAPDPLPETPLPEVPVSSIDMPLEDIRAIPEPGTYALMGLGLMGVALVRRRQTA